MVARKVRRRSPWSTYWETTTATRAGVGMLTCGTSTWIWPRYTVTTTKKKMPPIQVVLPLNTDRHIWYTCILNCNVIYGLVICQDKTSGKKKLDGFLLYLFGVVVKILQREDGLPNFSGSSNKQFQRFASLLNSKWLVKYLIFTVLLQNVMFVILQYIHTEGPYLEHHTAINQMPYLSMSNSCAQL